MISVARPESNKGNPYIASGISSALEFPETLKRRKTKAVSPQISGKTCTPRIDSTTVYIYQDENDAEPPVDPARATYCIHCINARDTPGYPGYHKRVANLMSRLWCSGCEAEHPAVQFSFASRRANPSSRLCIAHQGHVTVCPNLKISLKDLRSWRNAVRTQSIGCNERMCPCRGTTISYKGIRSVFPGDGGIISLDWKIPLDDLVSDTPLRDRCRAKIGEVYRSHPYIFCPAFNVTPARLLQARFFNELETSSLGFLVPSLSCSCGCTVSYASGFQDDKVEVSRRLHIPADADRTLPHYWLRKLDPESYGHFRDPETMHITWCCEPTCATTAELIKFDTMVTMNESYWSGPDEPRARSNLLDSLVDKNLRYIMLV
jgi:hypothetical protein